MPALSAFDYAIVRIVPRVEREECINAGVILFCRERRFLAALVRLDAHRLAGLAPEMDPATVRAHLEQIPAICRGGAAAGPLGELTLAERFRWLTAPRSTVVQVSPVHAGLCAEPDQALAELMAGMVGEVD